MKSGQNLATAFHPSGRDFFVLLFILPRGESLGKMHNKLVHRN